MTFAVVLELREINVVHRVGRGQFFGQRFERAFGFRLFLNRIGAGSEKVTGNQTTHEQSDGSENPFFAIVIFRSFAS